ncbi:MULTISPECIES: HlyD family secretion protein [unclassified Pseudomonas]|uniref:HlyD family secretion protein n=1 Tax=unclassified Pseudomonas TaxID=196821 RepID=UPI000BCA9220|nr:MULTISPECIES: HlyD family secretion protein [unclassified Pseudomonas]PVZ16473.1 membrane fusion protein (multidrug efflux system) [Pseudomonas sp. URIL14HWK12:I12]PVZ25671.1 membrane fusion protein (multidrug efflux system) [Pseudomonas sp. URIL14HWK12:I10]PVZ36805.1 membrane fusion protein (multidrug efflux system) [Pseudomonas sp. URIL14HWK12:I11]SNZ12578.1 membrane fusion protein, multidrug efflux system [Pseudomonas sp. URIL14HWK12:I9]
MNIAVDEQAHAEQLQAMLAKRRARRRITGAGGACLAALLVVGGWWWLVGRFHESTDDAYVQADWMAASARVQGYVDQVRVEDNQPVKAGQVLLRLQARDYQARLDQANARQAQAKAAVDAAHAEAQVAQAEVRRQQPAIERAQSQLDAARAESQRAQLDLARYQGLVRDQAATPQRLETTRAAALQARAAVQGARAALLEQQQLLQLAQAKVQRAQAQAAQASASLAEAQAQTLIATQNLEDTVVRAPFDGMVGQRKVRPGQYVVAGQPLLAVVPLEQAYVVANFKETQLEHLRIGQPVSLSVDSYPGLEVHGHVDSFAPGSGALFALLPPDNATGNFTKIVQRFPVRIRLDPPQAGEPTVRPGMSVVATVDTHVRAQP